MYGVSSARVYGMGALWVAARGGKSSSSKEGEGAWRPRRLRMELDRARVSERRVVGGLGSNAEELVRDDVEAMEAAWVKIEYVADLEGPILCPRCCWGRDVAPRVARDLVLAFEGRVDGGLDEEGSRWNASIVGSEGWRPEGG